MCFLDVLGTDFWAMCTKNILKDLDKESALAWTLVCPQWKRALETNEQLKKEIEDASVAQPLFHKVIKNGDALAAEELLTRGAVNANSLIGRIFCVFSLNSCTH